MCGAIEVFDRLKVEHRVGEDLRRRVLRLIKVRVRVRVRIRVRARARVRVRIRAKVTRMFCCVGVSMVLTLSHLTLALP